MMRKRVLTVSSLLAAGVLFYAAALTAQTAQSPVKVQPPAAVREKAATPPASAKKGTTAGKGKASANTANAAGDNDSVWVEELDIDGDGNVEETSILWDDEDKVMYFYADGTFTCQSGGTGMGGMLVAVYGKGNTAGKPAGSGWWAAEIDKSECGAEAAALVGCAFDAAGSSTACGVATIDEKNDAIVIAVVKK